MVFRFVDTEDTGEESINETDITQLVEDYNKSKKFAFNTISRIIKIVDQHYNENKKRIDNNTEEQLGDLLNRED